MTTMSLSGGQSYVTVCVLRVKSCRFTAVLDEKQILKFRQLCRRTVETSYSTVNVCSSYSFPSGRQLFLDQVTHIYFICVYLGHIAWVSNILITRDYADWSGLLSTPSHCSIGFALVKANQLSNSTNIDNSFRSQRLVLCWIEYMTLMS
jgi:hypothetical protein